MDPLVLLLSVAVQLTIAFILSLFVGIILYLPTLCEADSSIIGYLFGYLPWYVYGEFVLLYSCLMHTYGTAQVTELQQ